MEKSLYFPIESYVSKRVLSVLGEDRAWSMLDRRLIRTMDIIQIVLSDCTIIMNDWKDGGRFSQRGFRENVSPIPMNKTTNGKLYLSPHVLGKAVDFDVVDVPARDVRDSIVEMSDVLPYKIRLEDSVNWVHLDVLDYRPEKIYFFKP